MTNEEPPVVLDETGADGRLMQRSITTDAGAVTLKPRPGEALVDSDVSAVPRILDDLKKAGVDRMRIRRLVGRWHLTTVTGDLDPTFCVDATGFSVGTRRRGLALRRAPA